MDPGPHGAAYPGGTLTYEVVLVNNGAAYTVGEPAVLIDDLTNVLDNASIVEGSLYARVGATEVAPPTLRPDGKLMWTGALGAGEQVMLRYSVLVKADPGDGKALNVAFATTNPQTPTPAPEGCVAPTCATTDTPVVTAPAPQANVVKSVKVSSGKSTAVKGDKLTYSVTVSNVGGADFTESSPATVLMT